MPPPYPPGRHPGAPPGYPPPRRRWALWLSLGLVAALLLCVTPAGVVASRFGDLLDGVGAAGGRESARPAPSPRPGDPQSVRTIWIRERITEALSVQAAALLDGDRDGFLALVDPDADDLADDLGRVFDALRALRVTVWEAAPTTNPGTTDRDSPEAEWRVPVALHHCFVVAGCETDRVNVETRWRDRAGAVTLIAWDSSLGLQSGPRPWEDSELVTEVGERVVVATVPRYRDTLPRLLKEAEAAARVADRYVMGEVPPDRYRIFYAGSKEWRRWYGGGLAGWAVGYAIPVSDARFEVVLNAPLIEDRQLAGVLLHELTHVATLAGAGRWDSKHWWLVEGVAEYVENTGRPVGRYLGMSEVREFLARGDWDGLLAVDPPGAAATDWDAGGRYGIGYLAVQYLASRYGEAKMIDFFRAAVWEDHALDDASTAVFGVPWERVEADCAAHIRATAG